MSRREFIEAQGATCKNWTWSWSFVNHKRKVVIFGAWDRNTDGNTSLILSTNWEVSAKGRRQPAYEQAREHIRLVEEEGYQLQTFPLIYSDAYKDENGIGPSKIGGFEEILTNKSLKMVGNSWYASDGEMSISLAEEIIDPGKYIEGASKTVSVNVYERNAKARKKCIAHHGYNCSVCDFNFREEYGSIGENFIHVHHVIPLGEIRKEYELDPVKDLIPICPNCHAMIHSTQPALTVSQLKRHLESK
jgi:5-methylcytosine-specific restriction protein A